MQKMEKSVRRSRGPLRDCHLPGSASLVRATQPSDEQLAEPRLVASGASERIGGAGKKLFVDCFGEQNFREKFSAQNSSYPCHLSASTGHGRLRGSSTSSTQIIVMEQCKQEQSLVTCSSLIPFCFYRCAVHGNEMISSSKHLSRGETNQLFTNASK